ncbi:MAG: hypothetical protein JW969_00500 [Spirochaetales bacterium]|nr:hypothetical protein [Spirochaetales bacterium]
MKISFIIPGIPFIIRVILFAAMAAFGVFYQFYFDEGSVFSLGTLIIGLSSIWIISKNYKNKPVDLGFEDWTAVSDAEFQKIKDNLKSTKSIKYPFYFKQSFGVGLIVVFIIVLFGLFIIFESEDWALLTLIIDAGILCIPVFFSGAINLWVPGQLGMKITCFNAIINSVSKYEDKFVMTPYLRLDKDKEGRRIPEDIRFMLEPKRKPADFLGVQFQVAINNGPNGAVPYMYSVFLCKGKGETFNSLAQLDFGNYINEPGGDDEYGYMVVRQQTGGGGYHTSPNQCKGLAELVMGRLQQLSGR